MKNACIRERSELGRGRGEGNCKVLDLVPDLGTSILHKQLM